MAEEQSSTGVQDKGTVSVNLLRGTRLSGVWQEKDTSVEVPTWLALAMERTGLVEGNPSGIKQGRQEDEQPRPGKTEDDIDSPLAGYSSSEGSGSSQEEGGQQAATEQPQEQEQATPTTRSRRRGSKE